MATLSAEKRPGVCDWLLGKRIYLQFMGSTSGSTSTDAGAKMGGVAIAVDDRAIVLQEGERIYFVPWTSIRWVHPLTNSQEEIEDLAGWMGR